MAETPKKRLSPKDLADKSDAVVAERLFGKKLKGELDTIAHTTIKLKD